MPTSAGQVLKTWEFWISELRIRGYRPVLVEQSHEQGITGQPRKDFRARKGQEQAGWCLLIYCPSLLLFALSPGVRVQMPTRLPQGIPLGD